MTGHWREILRDSCLATGRHQRARVGVSLQTGGDLSVQGELVSNQKGRSDTYSNLLTRSRRRGREKEHGSTCATEKKLYWLQSRLQSSYETLLTILHPFLSPLATMPTWKDRNVSHPYQTRGNQHGPVIIRSSTHLIFSRSTHTST